MKANIMVEYHGKKLSTDTFMEKIKEIWKQEDKFVKDIKTCEVYYKVEEQTCYYIINGNIEGSFKAKMK